MAMQVLKKEPVLGVGIGDKKLKLVKPYIEKSTNVPEEHTFNPHNQFLDYWISAGIIPLLCFILFLVNEFSIAWRNKHFTYLGLVYCFTLFCFTDIAMTGQRGQVFFLFFICFFGSEIRKKKKTERDMALPLPV
jgi:O-antigen ligase